CLSAQSGREDSLLRIVREHKNDNSTFRALKRLGDSNSRTNAQRAISYYRRALAFPFHMEYSREFVQAYNALGDLYHILGKYDSSLLMHRQALGIAQKFTYENEIAETYQGIALTFMRQSQPDSARAYLQQALAIWVQSGNTLKQASVYVNLGNVYLDETNYTDALDQFIKAEKIYESPSEDKEGLSKALGNIGNIESILGNNEMALEYTQRALTLSRETKNNLNVAYCHRLLGRIYRKKSAYEKALSEYREANAIYTLRGDQRNESETCQSIGNIFYDLREYKSALAEYEKSLRIAHRISNTALMAFSFSGMGFAWYELKKFNQAIIYFDSSIVKAKEIKNRYLVMDAYQVISNIHEEQSHYQEALKFHRLYSELKDSLAHEENRQGTEEMEAKYQNAKKQNQIELLQKDQLVKDISLQQNRTVQSAMVLAFGLLIVIGLLVYNRHRLIHNAKRQMEIEQMRNEIARDLHDDMGSTLSSIHIISQLALKEAQGELYTKYFQRIADHSAKMMESMSDMVWSINPENDSLQKMLAKMKEFSAEMLEPKNMSYQFHGDETFNGTALDVAKRKNLFLIFKETIKNAAKYSEGTFVDIQIAHVDNDLQLIIRDNGKGFDVTKVQHGNGLRNMRARAREINADLGFETVIGKGTTLKLKLPLT
ncbi:MAG TPA: tetratricopeptide repeat protein, partial [Cyclobacteriaceae bacterium]|nr:tetratricopeptide repeat protein [Cyclobacteriaceae bacterium]